MYPVQLPESREEQEWDFVDEFSPKRSVWPLVAFLALVAIVLVSVAIWG